MTEPATSLLQQIETARSSTKASVSSLQSRMGQFTDDAEAHRTTMDKYLQDWRSFECQLTGTQADLDQRMSEVDQQQEAVLTARARIAERLLRRRRRMADRQVQLDDSSAELDAIQTALTEATAHVTTLERQLSERQAQSLNEQAESQNVRDELVSLRVEESTWREQLAESRQLLSERAAQLSEARQHNEQLTRRQQADDDAAGNQADELIELRRQRDELQDSLAELKSKAAATPAATADDGEVKDLRRRFELAVESVRSLKNRNESLTEQLSKLQNNESSQSNQVSGSGGDRDGASSLVTDKLLKNKDQRIVELETALRMVQERQKSGEEAERSDASIPSSDIHLLEKEWMEKQRASEVALAVERAQNARMRTELEEKTRDLEAELALARKQRNATSTQSQASKPGWLSNLRRKDEE